MAITFALHAFHTHVHDSHSFAHSLAHYLRPSTVNANQNGTSLLRTAHFNFNHQTITDLSPKGRDRLETLPWVRSHLGRINIIQGPSSTQIGYTHFRRGWKRDGPVLITYRIVCSTHTYDRYILYIRQRFMGNTQLTNVCLKIIFSMGKLETRRSSKFN